MEGDCAANAAPSALRGIFKANLGHIWFSLLEIFLNCSAKENALRLLLTDGPMGCLSWGCVCALCAGSRVQSLPGAVGGGGCSRKGPQEGYFFKPQKYKQNNKEHNLAKKYVTNSALF